MSKRFDPVLAAITVAAAIGGALLVARVRNWSVMPDELLYADMARSIAGSGLPLPALRGDAIHLYQLIFPTLIAPIVGLATMPTAYPIIAILNAVLFACTAIPTYLLANFVTGNRTAARWVAACAVVVPWLAFASKVMPDAVAYFAFTTAAYAIARTAIPEPGAKTLRPDLLALLALTVAYLTRNQFVVLVAGWLAIIVWCAIVSGRARSIAKRPVPIATFVIVALVILFKPIWLLGVYSSTTTSVKGGPVPGGLFDAIAAHISVLGLGLAGLPLVLGLAWLTSALIRGKEHAQLAGAATISILGAIIIFVGASFDVRYGQTDRVIERYIFYAAPLLLTAMAGFCVAPPRKLLAFAIPAIIGLLLLSASDPFGQSAAINVAINQAFSPVQLALVVYQHAADAIGTSIKGIFLLAMIIAGAIAWVLVDSKRNATAINAAFGATFVVLLVLTLYTVPKVTATQTNKGVVDRTAAQKIWLDNAVGDGLASVVYSPPVDVAAKRKGALGSQFNDSRDLVEKWWNLQFWNDQLSSIYSVDPSNPRLNRQWFGTAYPMVPDWKTGKLTRALGDDATWMVLADNDPRFQPFAVQTARHAGFVAYETSDQAWAQWATRGLTYHGWMPATPIELRIWSPQVTVRLNTTGQKQVVPITTTTIDFATTRPGTLDAVYVNGDLVPLKEHNGRARLILSKQQNDGQNQDWRLLRSPRNLAHGNMHVEKIRVRPPMLPSP